MRLWINGHLHSATLPDESEGSVRILSMILELTLSMVHVGERGKNENSHE